jgi:hypothetical protein
MIIYIAASWKHQHAVEMLTAMLRERKHDVRSFVENNYGEGHSAEKPMPFEEWMKTEQADHSYIYDSSNAKNCDLCIYIGPSGKDAAAEVGMASAMGITVVGLWAKGEDFGLMRKMMAQWFTRYIELLAWVDVFAVKERYNW